MTPREERHLRQIRDGLDAPARDSLFALLPKRTIAKVLFLLVLLAAVIYFKRRTDLLLGVVESTTKIGGHPLPTPADARPNSVPSSRR